jgi:hypothetical protein
MLWCGTAAGRNAGAQAGFAAFTENECLARYGDLLFSRSSDKKQIPRAVRATYRSPTDRRGCARDDNSTKNDMKREGMMYQLAAIWREGSVPVVGNGGASFLGPRFLMRRMRILSSSSAAG